MKIQHEESPADKPFDTGSDIHMRAEAAMLLSGAGDALGFRGGAFEFCTDGAAMEEAVAELGGLESVPVSLPDWPVSDDTVQHLATTEALARHAEVAPGEVAGLSYGRIMGAMADLHVSSWPDTEGRAPGGTCRRGVEQLQAGCGWLGVRRLDGAGTGCGAAMRVMGLGLALPAHSEALVALAADSAMLSHNHIHGVLSAVVAAAFTAYALEREPPVEAWPDRVVHDLVPRAMRYLRENPHGRASACSPVGPNADELAGGFVAWWKQWLARGDGLSRAQVEDASSRDGCFEAMGGGWDAVSCVQIAFEALRLAGGSWLDLVRFAGLHGGDSDSTLCIAAAWFGAARGLGAVPPCHVDNVEYAVRLRSVGRSLAEMRLRPVRVELSAEQAGGVESLQAESLQAESLQAESTAPAAVSGASERAAEPTRRCCVVL